MNVKDIICPHCGKDFRMRTKFGNRMWLPSELKILRVLAAAYPEAARTETFNERFIAQRISIVRLTLKDSKMGNIQRVINVGWRLVKGENWPSVEDSLTERP